MNQLLEQALQILRGMWRRRWYGVLAAWVCAIVGTILVLRVADRFEAEARVYVDTKSVLRPLMRDLAVEPDLDQTIAMLGRTLITRPNVAELIRKAQLEPAGRSVLEHERMVDGLMLDIRVTAIGRDNVFVFSYRHSDPEVARRVVQDLVSLFVESDLGAKQRDAQSARSFIEEQIRQYEGRLTEAEGKVKEFKLRNLGSIQGHGGDYFARIATLREDLIKQSTDLHAAEQSRDALRRELAGEVSVLVPDTPPPVAALSTPELDARLDTHRRQLDDLLRRFTEIHPDVVATRKVITRLEEQRQLELETQRKAAAAAPPKMLAENSTAQRQARLALAEAEAAVAGLKSRMGETQARLAQMTAAAGRVPQIEAELAQLNRDYDVVRRQYEAMVARREKAALSEDVDATRPAQFRIIDPPRVAPRPVFPNRSALASAVLFGALIIGCSVATLISLVAPTFDSAAALRRITKRPVLGSVSLVASTQSLRVGRRQSLAFGGALGGLILAFGAWLAWLSALSRA